ncbi:MAG: MBL fold metallo-hydrolase [Desulfurococcales archaeon]|nr:MBL fold metallo-hydrolase [Desulfurococcales archaeon]
MRYEFKILDVTPWGERLIASYLLVLGDSVILVDTGPRNTVDRIIGYLDREGIKLDYIVLTHIHLDHAGGAGSLVKRYPDAKVLVHPRGARHMINPSRLWEASKAILGEVADIYGKPEPIRDENVIPISDGETINIGDFRLVFLHTPGHASHHMSISIEPLDLMFIGDSAGIVVEIEGERIELPSTPPPFKPDAYIRSVKRMIEKKPKTVVPGHFGSVDNGHIYLEKHLGEIERWITAVKEALAEGITDPDRVAEYVANKSPTASRAYSSDNPVVSKMFYYGTIWGLVEALKEQ